MSPRPALPDHLAQGVPAGLDGRVPAAPGAYDGEDAAGAPAAGQRAQGDGRGLSVPHEAGQEGRGVRLLLNKARHTLETPRTRRAFGRLTGAALIAFGVAAATTSG